ncbi:ribosomal L28e/Mak16 [Pavlovales sp. CCMP2436]|nr:ribosomal L28e/Mak16 [Pavlovales sp. CCMP2436]
MANVSPDLIWGCVKNTSAFLRKGRFPGVSFSTEPGNLTNKASFKASGLANKKTIDIVQLEGGKLQLTTNVTDFEGTMRKPARMKRTTVLSKNMTAVAKTLTAVTADTFYRADLKRAAIAKACALKMSVKRKASGSKAKPPRKKWEWK